MKSRHESKRRRPERPSAAKAASRPELSGLPTDWGAVAGWYDQLVGEAGSEYHREVVIPRALRLLGLRAGEACLDVACGQGVLCRVLHEMGVKPTGVDAARELIRLARERSDPAIQYHVGDARDLSFLPAEAFDAAACILAIQNIHPILPVFQSVHRVLRPWGRWVMVMMHPCFRGPKETSWGWDEARKVQYRRVDRYLIPRKAPIVMNPGKAPDRYTWSFHKPIEAYVKALRNAGLFIDAIEEWTSHKHTQAGPRAAAENAARKEIPLFMAMRAVKVVGVPAPESLPPELGG
ncbi:MAG TPA: methyltransferase domain-containing protein [Phycisphaerae bacterium]|jgi:ubiquinone/menaquinone biosynthesis C-methylase UbiE|nr:methyltransferase domain-containing protein [Phycisphaerae bacterium]HOB75447.1 methyltransferase domain-containing protein [Phycisphaerae bacterium]HOJ56693.1 methyltransferase domain-containing protein [Phycisphaerae bacterium]HOL28440.1 methyltransferase domain-containing protein [Phycisphaerae bacterium]HPP22935.1 methyltransferase domain-containing protein [Phycisphaerae bacterium]